MNLLLVGKYFEKFIGKKKAEKFLLISALPDYSF